MNMHGIIEPAVIDKEQRPPIWRMAGRWLWRQRMFTLIVLLPSILVAGYLFLFASDQYEAEAHFLVRSTNESAQPATGIGQVLSFAGVSPSQNEAMSVADYLTSPNAVAALRKNDQLVERFHRSDVDLLSRLRSANPTPEKLLKYYQKQITVKYDTETGITSLTVHSFRPEDSYQLVNKLLQLGEQRVNTLNERSYNDAISMARKQLAQTEDAVAAIQLKLTNFRQSRRDIDPQASGEAQITLVSNLTSQLTLAKAQLSSMQGAINPSSPQYRALSARVNALSAQVAAQTGRLTGSQTAIAADIGGYEDLKLRQQFLGKRYEAAAASLEHAREEALRQQLYVVRVVEPSMPVTALYPQRWRIFATVMISLLLAYSIGWLIAAGVKEHAA